MEVKAKALGKVARRSVNKLLREYWHWLVAISQPQRDKLLDDALKIMRMEHPGNSDRCLSTDLHSTNKGA